MRKDHDESVDPSKPALVVTYGNTTRRRRALDRDLFVLGRSPSSDLNLASPEVAPVHCIIFRSGGTWCLRDCSGRPGTRVNGKVVQETVLHDTDSLQVGTFSFQLQLPYEPERPRETPTVRGRGTSTSGPLADEIEHLRRSRRRLGEMALEMRRQLQELQTRQIPVQDPAREASKRQEWTRKEEELRQTEEDLDDRVRQLEQEEKALAQTRIAIDCDADALQKLRSRCQRELAKARQDAEAEIKARWQEFEQRCQQAEQEQKRALLALPTPAAPVAVVVPSTLLEESRQLDQRRAELACFARHLQRTRLRLQDSEKLQAEIGLLRAKVAALQAARAATPVAQHVPDHRAENERLRKENSELRRKLEAPRQDLALRVQIIKLEGQIAGLRKQAELAAAAEQQQHNRLVNVDKEMRDRDDVRDPLAALRSQEADTVVDGKLEEAPKPALLTGQRRRGGS